MCLKKLFEGLCLVSRLLNETQDIPRSFLRILSSNFRKLKHLIKSNVYLLHFITLWGDRALFYCNLFLFNRNCFLFRLHGNHFGTEGVCKIVRPLILHPRITCLDVGDCDLGDKGLKNICELLPPDGSKPGRLFLVS